jgi:hypothetical protein
MSDNFRVVLDACVLAAEFRGDGGAVEGDCAETQTDAGTTPGVVGEKRAIVCRSRG